MDSIYCFILLVPCTNCIIIGFKITLFILSLYYCLSNIAIFYILNMVALIFAILYLLCTIALFRGWGSGEDESECKCDLMLIFRMLVFFIFIYDFSCYYFYFIEGIEQLSPLILLIINDVLFTSSFYVIYLDWCAEKCC